MRALLTRGPDRGESLVEVLVAVAILGIAGVAVLGGLEMSVKASDVHRKETTGGAYVRSFAEAIERYVADHHYQACAGADAYKVSSVMSQLALPSGYIPTQDAARSVDATGTAASGCVTDTGIQQVTLQLRKPCDPSVTPCAS
jgi:prepilin-type N-terminal cleavage/methylation domain-containing protein